MARLVEGTVEMKVNDVLDDDEVAAVVTYIRVAWENSGTPVKPAQANDLRKLLPE
jgi:mono/diheme cytochrome c family protein